MVGVSSNTLSRVFTAIGTNPRQTENINFPMLNSVVSQFSSFLSTTGQIRKKKYLMNAYYALPELTGITNKVARDIVSDYEFIPMRSGDRGRRDKKRAEEFAETQFIDKTRFAQVVDALVCGEGFGYMKGLAKKSSKEALYKAIEKKMSTQYKHIETKEKLEIMQQIKEKLDEDLRLPKKYINMASTTVEVINDQYEILGYKQWVNSRQQFFDMEEIIRFNLMDIDGRVGGFTPVESLITQLDILKQMWDNQLALQNNGGVFDRVIVAKNVQPNSPGYKKIREQLLKYKHVQNRHGSMLFTGDIDIHKVEQMDQMQFKDAGLYITGIMALQWSVPRSSLPLVIGGTNTKDDTGGNSERDYWNNVEYMQQLWATFENTQMWMDKFNVRIRFKRKFKQSMIQEETYRQAKLNNDKLMNEMLMMNGKMLNKEAMIDMFQIDSSMLTDVPEQEPMEEGGSTLDKQPSKSDADSDDKKNQNMKKREQQFNLMSNNGTPSGVGKELTFKEWDTDVEVSYKEIVGKDTMNVDFMTFVKLYTEDKQMGMQPPRLFVRRNDQFTTFIYKSTDFVYKSGLATEDLESNQINLMNLRGNMFEL